MKRRNVRYPFSVPVEVVTEDMKSWLKANDVAPYCANVIGHYSNVVRDEEGRWGIDDVPGTEAVSFWKRDAAARFEREFGGVQ